MASLNRMNLAEIRWIDIEHRDDERGTLTAIEPPALPFDIKRFFYMHRVPSGQERGGHAHRYTQQCAIAVAGSVTIDATHAGQTRTYVLDDPNRGLYLPPMTWVRVYAFQPLTVALVVCDTIYAPQHVVRDWDEYCRLLRAPSRMA